MKTKKCNKCGGVKRSSTFYHHHYTCKNCERELSRRKTQRNNQDKISNILKYNLSHFKYNPTGDKKQCIKCNQIKDIKLFTKNKDCFAGRSNTCNICSNIISSNWANDNQKAVKKLRKKNYENNRESEYLKNRKWAKKNRDKINKQAAKRRLKNPELARQKAKEYRLKNIDHIRAYDRKRRADPLVREKRKEAMKKRYHNGGGKELAKQWETKNKEKRRNQAKEWLKNNPGKASDSYLRNIPGKRIKDRLYIKELHDSYIKKNIDLPCCEITQDLIDLKRAQIKLYRASK